MHMMSVASNILHNEKSLCHTYHSSIQRTCNKTTPLRYDPFHRPIIEQNGQVNIENVKDMQTIVLDTYPSTFFKPYRSAVFHVDSGASIHTSNDKRDFIIFHPIKMNINLAVGLKAQCEGIGAIFIKLTPTIPPILLTPVYYCLASNISTISPSALKYYNNYIDVTIKIHKSLEF